MTHRKRLALRIIFIGILAAALLFRVCGMGFGLPQKIHPDEPILVERAVDIALKDNFNTSFFLWPNFMIYLLYFEYLAVSYVACFLGLFAIPKDFFVTYHVDPSLFMWIGRITTTIFCIGGMAWIYLLGKRIAGTTAGMAAAVLMGFNLLFITHSRYVTPDIPATCLMIYVWLSLIHYIDSGRLRMLYLAAFVGGLATSTKYNAAPMIIPILIASLIKVQHLADGKLPALSRRVFVYIPVCIVLFALGFVLFTPFSVLDAKEFWKQINTQATHQYLGHIGMEARGASLLEIAVYFITPYGISILAFAILGLGTSARPLHRGLILFTFPVIYLLAISGWIVWNERYMLYILPIIFISAGVGIGRLAGLLAPKNKEIAGLLIALIISLPSIVQGIRSVAIMNRPHTNVAAVQWIEKNIPHGGILFIEQGGPEPYNITQVKEYKLDVYPVYAYAKPELSWNIETVKYEPMEKLWMLHPIPGYIVSTGYTHDRYFDPETQRKYPDLVKPWVEYYQFIDEKCILLAEFIPGDEYSGWWVKIYRLPKGALEDWMHGR